MYKILAIVVLIGFSAYFSASETAFTSVNRIRIKNLANDGDKKARAVQELSERYDDLLSTILVGNNIVNIATSAIATVLFMEMYPLYGATISTIVVTIVVLIFGEISPKSLAKENPEKFAMASAPLLKLFMLLFAPVNWLFKGWKKFLALIFHTDEIKPITEDELLTIVEEAETEGGIDEEQSELIQNAIEFNELEAWDVLTPRVDIKAAEIDAPLEEIEELFLSTGFSRLPIYEDDLDSIVGVLNQKDFHNYIKGKNTPVSEYVKPVIFVAGSMKISQLLKRLQMGKTHIAIIVDEYGGTSGLVTMEDIIEELVGEIYDEHDDVSEESVEMADGSRVIEGGMELTELLEGMGLKDTFNAETVGGWVSEIMGCIPFVGARFETDHLRGMVTRMEKRRVTQVRIWRKEDTDGHTAQA